MIRCLTLAVAITATFSNSVFAEDKEPVSFTSATATSVFNDQLPGFAIDGVTNNTSRWLSENINSQHRLTLEFGQVQTVRFFKVAMGWSNSNGVWSSPISNFRIQRSIVGNQWVDIPGAQVSGNTRSVVTLTADAPVTTDAIRLVSDDDGYVRVAEVYAFDDSAGELPVVELERPNILVNQSGYDSFGPKRFTAHGFAIGTPFEIVRVSDGSVVYKGNLGDGVGSFSDLEANSSGEEYFVRMNIYHRSDRFQIEPFWIEQICLEPTFRFFVDSRSVIGNIPTAYGADPWRDSPYYCYDIQSLVLNYLANPSFFDNLPIEIDYNEQKAMVLDPGFQLVSSQNVEDSLEAARTYYNEFDPPIGQQVPDIIQLLHWGYAFLQIKTQDWDYAGDPAGRQLHTQHVEKFAYFLYAFPHFEEYFSQQYYDDALQFALQNWDGEGGNLFDVIPTDIDAADVVLSTFKGRSCPGHSILPNLMMYEVALREGLPNADAFFDAAFNQTQYIISNFQASNVRLSKGQRMSEHMLPTGLFAFMKMYPDRAPAGLQTWIDDWVDVMIARSDNQYDFRRFGVFGGEDLWTIPRFGDESNNGGSGWNEPGNVAGVPGILIAMGSQASDQSLRPRLDEIATAHYDALFGRNPTGWHSAFRGPVDFPGVERGWQRDFNPNAAARLHEVRGTINSCATHEHYPDNLDSGFLRHPEGWTAFNAAFSVSLAMQCWDRTDLQLIESQDSVTLLLNAPVLQASATVRVYSESGDFEDVELVAGDTIGTTFSGDLSTNSQGENVPNDGVLNVVGSIRAEYGGGLFARQMITSIAPVSLELVNGTIVDGDLDSVIASDEENLVLQVVPTKNELTPPIAIEFDTIIANGTTIRGLNLIVESSTNTLNIGREIMLFNYVTDSFESVSFESESFIEQQLASVAITDSLGSYLGPKNELKVRITWVPTNPVLLYPWQTKIDRLYFSVQN